MTEHEQGKIFYKDTTTRQQVYQQMHIWVGDGEVD